MTKILGNLPITMVRLAQIAWIHEHGRWTIYFYPILHARTEYNHRNRPHPRTTTEEPCVFA